MSSVAFALIVLSVLAPTPNQTTEFASTDPHIRYVGRFDFRQADGPRCSWPASSVQVGFKGTSLKIKVKESGLDQLQIVMDGTPTTILKPSKGDGEYVVAENLPYGVHQATICKRTETFVGTLQFTGFLTDGELVHPKRNKRVIEVIGDSISCGYGNEGKNKEEHFLPDTENAYMTYGAIAARQFDADFVDIAWSGRKMYPDNTVPEIYDLALPEDKESKWDLKQQIPDVIVINLATNDFGKSNPDEKLWTQAYASFIGRLRERAPKARIYCAIGPMMSDNWPPQNKALSTLQRYMIDVIGLRAAVADDNIQVLEFATQDEAKEGIGSDWHPTITAHQRMANGLINAIRRDLHW